MMVSIGKPRLILWDFDGVIKDSVDVKTEAFVALFADRGPEVAERIRAHHEANGGMSRFEKIPLYLEIAGSTPSPELVETLARRFGDLVRERVVRSPWVPGAEEYLRGNPHRQAFVLVSATPQAEMEEIVEALSLTGCFEAVFGSPLSKTEAVRRALAERGVEPSEALLIGDARADLEAALANGVAFLQRRHSSNGGAFADYTGPAFDDFREL